MSTLEQFFDFPSEPLQWKPITGYEGIYEVSNHGRVKSLDRYVPCDYIDRHGNHVTEKFGVRQADTYSTN